MQRSLGGSAVVSVAVVMAFAPPGRAGELMGGVEWGESLASVVHSIEGRCESTHTVAVAPPSFPLAAAREEHLVCRGFRGASGPVEAAAFVFADDRLALIEAHGGAVGAFGKRKEGSRDYLHYRILDEGERFVDTASDTVWFLSQEALHPNLFTWSNPHLEPGAAPPAEIEASGAIPEILAFGERLDSLRPGFERACRFVQVDENSRVWLPHAPSVQTQVNCLGFEYAGFHRKVEAVFGDGVLELAWILTGGGEESRVRRALVEEFGEPEAVSEIWEVFHGGRIALRKDKPEVLMLSDRMVPFYRQQIGATE